jgi:hypothetical protein
MVFDIIMGWLIADALSGLLHYVLDHFGTADTNATASISDGPQKINQRRATIQTASHVLMWRARKPHCVKASGRS